MKIYLSSLFLIFSFCCSVQVNAKTCRVVGVSANDSLNVRSGIGANHAVVGSFSANQTGLEIFDCQNNNNTRWCLVADRNRQTTGWVAARYLNCDDETKSPAPAASAPRATGQAIGSWCQTSPYCSIVFDNKTYYFPVGWKITQPFYDSMASRQQRQQSATVISQRQSDGIKSYFNVTHQNRPDCNQYPTGKLCFEPSRQPITQQERHILGGTPDTSVRGNSETGEISSNGIEIVMQPLDSLDIAYWILQSANSAAQLTQNSNAGIKIYPDAAGRAITKATATDEYYLSGYDRRGEELTSVSIQIAPNSKKQCFLIPKLKDNYFEFQNQLTTYHLPHYYRSEGDMSGYNDGYQPLADNSDEFGHGPDIEYSLAPLPCERLANPMQQEGNSPRRIRRYN